MKIGLHALKHPDTQKAIWAILYLGNRKLNSIQKKLFPLQVQFFSHTKNFQQQKSAPDTVLPVNNPNALKSTCHEDWFDFRPLCM